MTRHALLICRQHAKDTTLLKVQSCPQNQKRRCSPHSKALMTCPLPYHGPTRHCMTASERENDVWPCIRKMRTAKPHVNFTEDGFVVRRRRYLWFFSHQPVKWNTVASIRAVMWDCFSCHAFGYRFHLSDGSSVCVTDLDLDDRWEDFQGRLYDAFPEIDSAVVRQVKKTFPGEAERIYWKKPRAQQT